VGKNISVIVPVQNEIIHIERCVNNALKLTKNVFVVDSSSTDGTAEKARSLGAQVYNYEWDSTSNFSKKLNWAFEYLPIETDWIIRLDADEYFLDQTLERLPLELEKIDSTINAVTLNRRLYFQGRWMKHGAQYPRPVVRVTRSGKATYQSRWLDEGVIVVDNAIANLQLDIADDSLIGISKWISKHNKYATQEVIEILHQEMNIFNRSDETEFIGSDSKKAQTEKKMYNRMPLFWRAFFYFNYRYLLKFGFLDGYQGFLWNFFQAFWYRMLIDVKLFEIRKQFGSDKIKIAEYIEKEFGIKI
jgi:glycosyltransferase involved in cell wall biosynthesis